MSLVYSFSINRDSVKVLFSENLEFLQKTSAPTTDARLIDLLETALKELEGYEYEQIIGNEESRAFRFVKV